MLDSLLRQEDSSLAKQIYHRVRTLSKDLFPHERRYRFIPGSGPADKLLCEFTVIIDRATKFLEYYTSFAKGNVIFISMSRCRVDETSTGL